MKIGICGTGDISHTFMSNIKDVSTASVSAVYNRDIKKAKSFTDKYEIKDAVDSYDALFKSCDLVYIALPNSLHFPYAKQALENKKHVIVEKPMCIDTKEFDILMDTAKRHDVMIFEMNRTTYLPNTIKIKELMQKDNGKSLISLNYCKRSRRYDDFVNGLNPNVFTRKFAGGALYDLGVYAIHFIIFILGTPLEMTYKANILSSGVDGSGIILLEYANTLVSINISKISNGKSDLLIQGENYTIEADTAVSVLNDFTFKDKMGDAYLNKQNYGNMYYAQSEIIDCILTHDVKSYESISKHTREVVSTLEYLRLSNDIIFE